MARRLPPVWALISAAWLGPAAVAAFTAWAQARLGQRGPLDWRQITWEFGDWMVYAVLTPAAFWLGRRFPLTRGAVLRRLPIHVGGAVLLCAFWSLFGILLSWAVFPGTPNPYGSSGLGWFMTSLPFGVAVYFAVIGVERATAFFAEAREREQGAARLSAQLAEARLGALRMQMQPHFLLNSLNAITVIVRDRDTATATRMLEHLGAILRRVTRTGRPPEVSLEEELDFVRQYLAIEAMRFSDRLRPVFDVDPALLGAAVPEFILQPLVENAIRYGLARRTGPTEVRIVARRDGDTLVLAVTDDGPDAGAAPAPPGAGVSLANIRERLATLYGDRARLDLAPAPGGGITATVHLPWRVMASA